MTLTNYDMIADGYIKSKLNPAKSFSEEYTFFLALNDVTGRSVIDFACGDGHYTRAIKRIGARSVTGVDISEVMIDLAQQEERAQRLGLSYFVRDITKSGKIGEFDIVTAVYLLPHAENIASLRAMCDAIYKNLKPAGRLVALTIDPSTSIERQPMLGKYGFRIEAKTPLMDGMPLTVTLLTPDKPLHIKDYYWSRQTYERCLKVAGFQDIAWRSMRVSNEGLTKFGNEYWQEFLDNPGIIVLEAKK
jgi:SAM-dependent methyltransferase